MLIGIIEYGMGNIFSVQKSLRNAGLSVKICSNPMDFLGIDLFILPGVGHFKAGMEQLNSRGLSEAIVYHVRNMGKPLIGICLGMQLLTDFSEEGMVSGLGLIKAHTKLFSFDQQAHFRVPHMGWNTLILKQKIDSIAWVEEPQNEFYFVHSYYVECEDEKNVLFNTQYGINFASGVIKDNIIGVQFHPEKSHEQGVKLFHSLIGLTHV